MTEIPKQEYILSSRKTRIAAFIIDHFILTFSIVLIVFLALGLGFMDEVNPGKMVTTMLTVMIPGFFVYFSKDAIKGMSIGKRVMGIMVRDEKNPDEIPSFGRLLVRNLFVMIWPVEFIVLAANQDKKRLGDKVAKTVVVKNPQKPKTIVRVLALAGVAIAFFSFIFLFVWNVMKSSDAYKTTIREIEQNQEILTETGGIKGYGNMPSGSISVSNGRGQAQFVIKVLGNKKDLNISAYLEKEPGGTWKLIELNK